MPPECLGGGPGETGKGGFDRRRQWVRRRQPENGIGAGECPVHNRRVAVRAHDNVKVLADLGREVCGIAGDDPDFSPPPSKLPSTWRPIWPVGVVITIMGTSKA
jgi:hypothetical protein